MSVFSKLKAALSGAPAATTLQVPIAPGQSWRSVLTAIGVTTPTCPHCGHVFEKMPQRKRACPKCRGVFYSRKRALDGAKVLLTEAQALDGDAQDALVSLTQEGASSAELDTLVHVLQGQLGRLPSADEVVAQHLARAAAAHAQACNWGLYRNARFNLAESCIRQRQREEALRLLLEVSLLDLNGPNNCGGISDPGFLRSFPQFNPKLALLAPGIIRRTVDVIDLLKLSPDEVHRAFEAVANAVVPALKLPLSPSTVWRELAKALADAQD